MRVKLFISGRGYHQSDNLPDELSLDEGATLADALAAVTRLTADSGGLSANALVAVSGDHLGTVGGHAARQLREGDELTIIAPVAGG